MPVRKIFSDGDGNELHAYVNDKAKLFIQVGDPDPEGANYGPGYITLDRSELDELIDLLMDLKNKVFDEADLDEPPTARGGGIIVGD